VVLVVEEMLVLVKETDKQELQILVAVVALEGHKVEDLLEDMVETVELE
jgi:hypothetical protein